jgi:excisionase family DNA binding protein
VIDDPTPAARDAVGRVQRLTYTVEETLVVLGIGRTAFYEQLINTGRLHTVVVGGRRLVPRAAVEALLVGGDRATT